MADPEAASPPTQIRRIQNRQAFQIRLTSPTHPAPRWPQSVPDSLKRLRRLADITRPVLRNSRTWLNTLKARDGLRCPYSAMHRANEVRLAAARQLGADSEIGKNSGFPLVWPFPRGWHDRCAKPLRPLLAGESYRRLRGNRHHMYLYFENNPGVASALLEVARIRFEAFRDRFGRDPEPDEPLLFDPAEDQPTAASIGDRTLQIVSAAMLCDVDAVAILSVLGLNQIH
jgi:hypothetical protein